MHAFRRPPYHDPNLAFATGGGAMGGVLRGFDWASTPLGPLESWPQSLRTATSMMLNARHPMYVAWGDELLLLYNDAYTEILGAKAADPAAVLGKPFKEVWTEVWEQVRPMLDATLRGESVWFEDYAFTLMRNGFPEEIHASFSTSPIRGESGRITGVLCICSETTAKVRTERERDAALAELATNVEKLRIAADSAELGMFDLHLPSGTVECDAPMRVHFSLPNTGDVSAAMLLDAVHPDDRDRVVRESEAVLAAPPGEDRYRMEYRTSGHTGQVRWIVTRGRLLRDPADRPLRLIGTTLDVTTRKNTEAATQAVARNALAAAQANAKFQAFFEQGIHFAALMAPDGKLVEVNRTAAEGCGYTREALIGQAFHDCAWWRPPTRSSQDIGLAIEGARDGRALRLELPYFVADGSERFADMSIAPVHDDNGALLFIAANWIDITERRKVEERLRVLDAIGEATRLATDPTAIMEHSTRLLGQYLGVTRVAYADLEPDNDRFTIRHDWRVEGAVSTAGVYSLDLFGSRARSDMRQGRTLVINDVDRELTPEDGAGMFNQIGIKGIICCPLVREGRLVAMMAVHQQEPRTWTGDDVALVEAVVDRCWAHIERVRSTEALRDADRRKSEFLATLAHELRNPLAPIRTALELLRMSGDNRALMDKVRATMERQLGHMVHLINDLLDIARISSGKVVLKIERVDLQTLVASAVETSLPLIEGAHHRLAVDVPDRPLWMDVDAVRISQVLSNLLSNAAKYTPRHGSIGIEVVAEQGTAMIRVSDTGIGIAREALDSVFDMFAQAPHSIGISKGGLGIGLSLVRHLVTLHGGSVVATSPGLGQGSTFVVKLPLADVEGSETPLRAPDTANAPSPIGRRLRILVADDNVDAADTLAHLLRAKGHDVHVAYDGREAVHIAAAVLPELAFLDIGMPSMDGYQVATALRASAGTARTQLVALTGWGTEQDRARSRAAGFDRHLLKPAAPEDVNAVLARSAARES